jgi:WD40 repeat protein
MARIFLSHSSVDNAHAVGLRDWLAGEGWDDVFLDLDPDRGITAGERWERALNEAASRCEAVLFLVSHAWLGSSWCHKELTLAHKLDKRLFGVLIETFDPTELPAELSDTWQVVDLASGRDHRQFRVTLPRTHEESHVTFSQEGLKRLRAGLVKAGLDPRFFGWPPETDPDRPPYRGLRPLEAEDAGIFFGRDAPIFEALDQLRGLREDPPPRLLVILGASGAGKSSFLRAGLFARMTRYDRDFLPLPIIRPGRAAISGENGLLHALEAARHTAQINLPRTKLRAAIDGGAETLRPVLQDLVDAATPMPSDADAPAKPPTLVISVDQGEELFRAEGHDEAQRLLDLLRGLLDDAAPALIVAIAIRSDSYAQLQEAKALEGLRKVPFDLGPMPHGSYAEVIKGPATRLEGTKRPLRIDDTLVGVLLHDIEAGGAKDALPLLSFTMERLYLENLGTGALTVTEYRNLGGIKGSIEEAVEQALTADTDPPIPTDRAARLALLRRGMIPWLADVDPDTGAPRRRVARLSEIPADCQPLLRNLVQQRLLTIDRVARTGEITIEPAHEALLRQWSLLEGWLTEDAALLAVLEGVKRASRDWAKWDKSTAWLTHAADRLAAAERLSQRPDLAANLNETDRGYLAECRAAENERLAVEKRQQEAELEAAKKLAAAEKDRAAEAQAHAAVLRKRSRVLRAVLACTVVVALVAMVAFFLARREQHLAQRNNQDAVAQKLFSEAQEILDRAGNATTATTAKNADDARAFQELLAANKLATKPNDQRLLGALIKRFSTDLISNGTLPVVGVAFAEVGHRLAVADSGGLRIWDTDTNSPKWLEDLRNSSCAAGRVEATPDHSGCRLLPATPHHLTDVAISADGQIVAAGSQEGVVQVWNLNDQQPAPKSLPRPHQGRVSGVAMSRDGRRLASAGVDGFIDVSQSDGTDMRPIENPAGAIFTVAFNRAADRLAAGGADGTIRIWAIRNVPPGGGPMPPEILRPGAHADGVRSVTFSPNDDFIASGGADNAVRLWDSSNLAPAGQLPMPTSGLQGHTAPVTSVAFSADGTRLVSGSDDKTVQLWDVAGRQRIGDPLIGHEGLVLSVAIVGDEIVSGGNEHALRFWNAVVGQPPKAPLVAHEGAVTSVAMAPGGRQIASGGVDGTVRLWNSYTGSEIKKMPAPAGAITRVAFNQKGDGVASGSADGKIRVWGLATDTVKTIDTGRPVTALAMNPGGNLLASGGIDGQITIRDLSSGRATSLENKDNAIVFDVAFNPRGDRLASGGVAGIVRLWDLTGREVWQADAAAELPKPFSERLSLAVGHPGEILGVAFSPDGRRLASGSTDWGTAKPAVGVIQRWDVNTGKPVGDPAEIGDAVMGLAFSSQSDDPAQDRVAAGSFDPYTVQLWSAANGNQYTFSGHQAQVVSVAVSRESALIVSGSVDGTVRIWSNPPTIPPADALCAKLTTTMSQDHWNEWVSPQIPYRKMCPGLLPTLGGMPS